MFRNHRAVNDNNERDDNQVIIEIVEGDVGYDSPDNSLDTHNVNVNSEEDAGVEGDQGVEEDPLPGGSRRRSRQEGGQEDEERGWWNEFDDSSTDYDNNTDDYDTDSSVYGHYNADSDSGSNPVKNAAAYAQLAEEDPLPGPSRKSSGEHDTAEDETSYNKSVCCYGLFNNIFDTGTDRPGQDPVHSSIDLVEGAEEEMDEDHQQVEEEARLPRPFGKASRKRPREHDDDNNMRDRKRFKR